MYEHHGIVRYPLRLSERNDEATRRAERSGAFCVIRSDVRED